MSEEKDLKLARAVYASLCEALDDKGWKYDKDDEKLVVAGVVRGDDIPIPFQVTVDDYRKLITLISPIPFSVEEDRRKVMAVAVCEANVIVADGSFDYEYTSGSMVYRLTSSYRESLIGKDLLDYMIMCACFVVDEFNDKFFKVASTDMSVEDVLNFIR